MGIYYLPPHRRFSAESFFPPVDQADDEGLLAVGGSLRPNWLRDAYAHGIFPWPCEGYPLWFSPPERALIEFDHFHISRRLRQTLRSGRFQVTLDQAFRQVVKHCATVPRADEDGTWITRDIQQAYALFHETGDAHSLEVWREGRLVGGIYGVAMGAYFAGESKFHLETDASKVALAWLVRHLQTQGFRLFDVQLENTHLRQFHLTLLPREAFLEKLRDAIAVPGVAFGKEIHWRREDF